MAIMFLCLFFLMTNPLFAQETKDTNKDQDKGLSNSAKRTWGIAFTTVGTVGSLTGIAKECPSTKGVFGGSSRDSECEDAKQQQIVFSLASLIAGIAILMNVEDGIDKNKPDGENPTKEDDLAFHVIPKDTGLNLKLIYNF